MTVKPTHHRSQQPQPLQFQPNNEDSIVIAPLPAWLPVAVAELWTSGRGDGDGDGVFVDI